MVGQGRRSIERIISKDTADCKPQALIFHRYLARQVAQTVLGILLVGLLVIAASRLLQYMQSALEGKLEVEAALVAVLLRLPEFLSLFLPLAWVLGLYLALARLWAGSEMTAAQFAAVSPTRVRLNVLAMGTLVALTTLLLSARLAPDAEAKAEQILLESRALSTLLLLDPGLFHDLGNGWEIHITGRQDNSLTEHMLFRQHTDGSVGMAWAPELQVGLCADTAQCTLKLDWPSGLDYLRFAPSGELTDSAQVASLDLPFEQPLIASDPNRAGEHRYNWPMQWHLALPLFCLIGALLVFPLAAVHPRQGALHNLPVALTLMLLYLLMLLVTREWLERGQINPLLGPGTVHLGFFLLAGTLFWRRQDR